MALRQTIRRWATRMALASAIVALGVYLSLPKPLPPAQCVAETEQLVQWLRRVNEAGRPILYPTPELRDVSLTGPEHPPLRAMVLAFGSNGLAIDGQKIFDWTGTSLPSASQSALQEMLAEKRRNIEQSAALLGDERSPLEFNLQIDERATWSQISSVVREAEAGGFKQAAFWFIQPQTLVAPKQTFIGDAVSTFFAKGYLPILAELHDESGSTLDCAAPISIDAMVHASRVLGCTMGMKPADEQFELDVAHAMQTCHCALNTEMLKAYAWKRFGPGMFDENMHDIPNAFRWPAAARQFWLEHRQFVGAMVTLDSDAAAVEIAFDETARWGDIARSFVDETARAGDRPVRLIAKPVR